MAEVNDWDVVDANNNAAVPNGWPEGMNYSEVNNTARADAGRLKRWFADIGGSLLTGGVANVYTLTLNAGYTALFDGLFFRTSFNLANTGAVTLDVNGLGAVTVQDRDGNALIADDIATGVVYDVMYDGTVFRLLNVFGSVGGADVITTAGGQTINGTLGVTGTLTLGAGLDAVGAITSDALTADRALISGVGGLIEVSAVTETELGHVSGVTSAIQTQLDGKIADSGTTTGTLLRWSGTAWVEYTSGPLIQGPDTIQSAGTFLKLGNTTDPDAIFISDTQIIPSNSNTISLGGPSNAFASLALTPGSITDGGTNVGFQFQTFQTDTGSSTVAYLLATNSTYSTAGAKLFRLDNFSTTKYYVDKDGGTFQSGDLLMGAGAQIFCDTGSAAAPGFTRQSNPATGIYFSSSNEMSVSTSGVQRFAFESDGTLSAKTASYETLVTAAQDIPNKKYVDDQRPPELVTLDTPILKLNVTTDNATYSSQTDTVLTSNNATHAILRAQVVIEGAAGGGVVQRAGIWVNKDATGTADWTNSGDKAGSIVAGAYTGNGSPEYSRDTGITIVELDGSGNYQYARDSDGTPTSVAYKMWLIGYYK